MKSSPLIPPGAWLCSALVSHNTHQIPTIRSCRCLGPRGPLLPPFHHPLVNAQSPGPGQPTKSFLLRDGFLVTLASSGHQLQVREDTNKSGSSLLSSIIGIRALSMFRGGTLIWCPRNSCLLVTSPPTTPPSLTLIGSPTLDVVSASLPLLTPGSPPLTTGPLLLPLPSILHPNASLPTCLVSLPYLLTIWICLPAPGRKPSTTQLRYAHGSTFEFWFAHENSQSDSFTYFGQARWLEVVLVLFLSPSFICSCLGSALSQCWFCLRFVCVLSRYVPLPGNQDSSVAPGVGGTPVNWLAEEGLADALSAWNPLITGPRCDHSGSEVSFGSAG